MLKNSRTLFIVLSLNNRCLLGLKYLTINYLMIHISDNITMRRTQITRFTVNYDRTLINTDKRSIYGSLYKLIVKI